MRWRSYYVRMEKASYLYERGGLLEMKKHTMVTKVNKKVTHETLSFNAFKSGKGEGIKLAIAVIKDLKYDPVIDTLSPQEILQVAIKTLEEYGK